MAAISRLGLMALCLPLLASPALADGCTASATSTWSPPGATQTFTFEAFTQGADCSRAVAVYVIRDKDGEIVRHSSHLTRSIRYLIGKEDPAAMTAGLAEWIKTFDPNMETTDKLPELDANITTDASGNPEDFGPQFFPDGLFDGEDYVKLRADKLPMICYDEGEDTLDCLVYEYDSFTYIGILSYAD